jgi:membrane-bound metal-dependent hydrolase YbcI (DUF457 family)
MIVGHFGVAFGARALDRRPPGERAPLPWLLAASVAPDLLDGLYALGRYCNPEGAYSHSLPALALVAIAFGAAAWAHTRNRTTALLVALLVVLHVPPDYLTGLKALWPHGPVVGLYLYRWPWLDFLVELPVIVAGWWMLRRSEYRPRWVVSGFALAALIAVQASFNVASTVGGPRQPPNCQR